MRIIMLLVPMLVADHVYVNISWPATPAVVSETLNCRLCALPTSDGWDVGDAVAVGAVSVCVVGGIVYNAPDGFGVVVDSVPVGKELV